MQSPDFFIALACAFTGPPCHIKPIATKHIAHLFFSGLDHGFFKARRERKNASQGVLDNIVSVFDHVQRIKVNHGML